MSEKKGFSTRCVHGGEDRWKFSDSITTPIFQAATYVFRDSKDVQEYTSKQKFRFEYGRYGNPTQKTAQQKLAILEGAESALLFTSGMNAVTTTILAFLSKGDHMIITDDAYKKTLEFCMNILPRFGIDCTIVGMDDYNELENAIKENTKIIFSESPTNPYLNIMDMEKVVSIRNKSPYKDQILLISDSTFATPINQRPLEFGIDLVIHSGTKYLGGHNDLLAGVVLGSHKLVETVELFHKTIGGVIDPHCVYLLLRGLKTFALRVKHQNQSAMDVAQYLEKHSKIKKVYYPGLPSHRHHKIAKAQMDGFGGVVSFEVDGSLEQTLTFLDNLKLCYIAPSLGGTETLITHPATVTYYDKTREERYKLGITDSLIRLALGVEDSEDIKADLDQALKKI